MVVLGEKAEGGVDGLVDEATAGQAGGDQGSDLSVEEDLDIPAVAGINPLDRAARTRVDRAVRLRVGRFIEGYNLLIEEYSDRAGMFNTHIEAFERVVSSNGPFSNEDVDVLKKMIELQNKIHLILRKIVSDIKLELEHVDNYSNMDSETRAFVMGFRADISDELQKYKEGVENVLTNIHKASMKLDHIREKGIVSRGIVGRVLSSVSAFVRRVASGTLTAFRGFMASMYQMFRIMFRSVFSLFISIFNLFSRMFNYFSSITYRFFRRDRR